jgi:hypothetical protein
MESEPHSFFQSFLERKRFFHASVTRETADRLLGDASLPDGSCLIRPASGRSVSQCVALSHKEGGKPKHTLIFQTLSGFQIDQTEDVFSTLEELLEACQLRPIEASADAGATYNLKKTVKISQNGHFPIRKEATVEEKLSKLEQELKALRQSISTGVGRTTVKEHQGSPRDQLYKVENVELLPPLGDADVKSSDKLKFSTYIDPNGPIEQEEDEWEPLEQLKWAFLRDEAAMYQSEMSVNNPPHACDFVFIPHALEKVNSNFFNGVLESVVTRDAIFFFFSFFLCYLTGHHLRHAHLPRLLSLSL